MKDKIKTIGIGSLPHFNIQDAIKYSFKHDIPFLPQMTSLGERMIEQVLNNNLDESYKALKLFKEEMIKSKAHDYKIQVVGPTSSKQNAKIILTHIEKLLNYFQKDFSILPILFIDEPVLDLGSNEFKFILNELTKMNVKTGIHCCNVLDYNGLMNSLNNSKLSFISFDQNLVSNYIYHPNIFEVVGVSPFDKLQNKFQAKFISSSCGLMNYNERECELILENLKRQK